MFTILGGDGKEYGPVTADKIQAWITGGRANLQTKARRDGETEWKTLGDFPEFTGATAVPPPVAAAPQSHPVVPEPMTGDASSIAADLKARTPKIDVFDCLSRSFELWKGNFWPLVGVTLLVLFIQVVIGFIPILGPLARLLLNGVFYGGLYYYYIGKARGQPREVGDAFAGFSKGFLQLMSASLLTTFLLVIVMLPFCAPLLLFLFKSAMHQHTALPVFTPIMVLSCMAGVVLVVFLSISWSFTFLLIIDKGLGPWTAMEVSRRVVARQWFRVFFVVLLGGILSLIGLVGLFIGVLFTLPLGIGAVIYAYEDLCNPPPKAA